MNKQILKKQLSLKSTMKLKDYYGAVIDDDRPDFLKDMRNYVEADFGDFIHIFVHKSPKLKRKKLFQVKERKIK